eukprot:jgi/Bigna1/146708/aug1.119_g21416
MFKTIHIYKLFNSVSDKFYIGSTCNAVRKRINAHKNKFNKWINNGKTGDYCSSFVIYEADKNVKWIEMHSEEISYETKIERDRKKRGIEARFIKKFKEKFGDKCVNQILPFGGSNIEWYEAHKKKKREYDKQYRKKNLRKIKANKNSKIKCEFCNTMTSKSNIRKHQKSKNCLKAQDTII